MSSSTSSSSSSSRAQRPPLHERSDSEKNKLQIRIVPYSPPRPEDDEGNTSHAPSQAGEDDGHNKTNDPSLITPRTTRATMYGNEDYGANSPSPSISTPGSPLARVKGRGVSGSKLASGSGGAESTAPPSPVINRPSYGSNIRRINPQSEPSPSRHDDDEPGSSAWKRALSRRDNYINVHSDKTFSVVLKSTRPRNSDRSGSTVNNPPLSNTSTISSHEESSFDASTEDRLGSPLSSVPERSVSPYTAGSPSTATELPDEHIESSSPWNYRMVGGLRKVPQTPDLKGKGKEKEVSESPLPPLPVTVVTPPEAPSSPLATKQSFNSEQTESTIEETTNYKVIGRSSPPLPDTESIEAPPSSSSSNYKLLGQSSPAQTLASFAAPPAFADFTDTPGSRNYIVYGETSPLSSSATPFRGHRYHSSDDSSLQLRERYSQESLVVPPLRPHKRSSSESLGYYKQQSRENLRGRANSFSSLTSIVSGDSASYFGGTPNVVRLHHTPSTSSIPRSTWVGPSNTQPRARMDTHQWSSQLSTVPSEYEGSDPGSGSRVVSMGSIPERVSSAFGGSRDSRQMRSISSSLGLENLETRRSHSRSNSQSDSLDRPGAAYTRNGREPPSPLALTVRDLDEHGDGLADLQRLEHRPSRTRLGFSRQPSDRSLRSTTSSRAGSFTSSSIPSWARLYYSNGGGRWLAPPSVRSVSEAGDSRPSSPWLGGRRSPSQDQFSQSIYNPRRRPREEEAGNQRPSSMEISPVVETGSLRLTPRTPKKKTSSIWSPHLRLDTRSGYSVWNTPSVTWSADSGVLGRRNIQVVLFIMGFLFPFAWMIAAFLPLPPKPMLAMDERDRSTTEFTSERGESSHRQPILVDDSRYQSARWWRNVNRFMSIAGLLILGAVAALVVIGVRQRWAR
ncbi:hypothetical protein GGS26DRAFT_271820 [Hypomontagnella submonticulosa]|nr:hypothetical protein GGS26DRAFT_271820 [Hypomontagnella submonticulosa]